MKKIFLIFVMMLIAMQTQAWFWQSKEHMQKISLPDAQGRVDLPALMRELATRGINEVHVEAGARLNGALLATGLIDEFLIYLAPSLIGHRARGLLDLPALESLDGKTQLAIRDLARVGNDIRILARPLA